MIKLNQTKQIHSRTKIFSPALLANRAGTRSGIYCLRKNVVKRCQNNLIPRAASNPSIGRLSRSVTTPNQPFRQMAYQQHYQSDFVLPSRPQGKGANLSFRNQNINRHLPVSTRNKNPFEWMPNNAQKRNLFSLKRTLASARASIIQRSDKMCVGAPALAPRTVKFDLFRTFLHKSKNQIEGHPSKRLQMSSEQTPDIVHNPDQLRFELNYGPDKLAYLAYDFDEETKKYNLWHTFVPNTLRGRGVANVLALKTVDKMAELNMIPGEYSCSYLRDRFVPQNKEYLERLFAPKDKVATQKKSKTEESAAAVAQILDSSEKLTAVFPLVQQLRPHLSLQSFLDIHSDSQKRSGYTMAALFRDTQPIAVVGARVLVDLTHGTHLYIDDLVVNESDRSHGYGELLLHYAENDLRAHLAKQAGFELEKVAMVRLCSGLEKTQAHRFYERLGYEKKSFAFKKTFTPNKN